MYKYKPKDFVLSSMEFYINDKKTTIDEILKYSCYIDHKVYPLFSSSKTVKNLIKKGLKKSKLPYSVDEIEELFELTKDRVERPIRQVGNERFRSMGAIGFAFGKEIFCFPWLSDKMFKYYMYNMNFLSDLFGKLNKIAIFPTNAQL
jgi:hypothetical protein